MIRVYEQNDRPVSTLRECAISKIVTIGGPNGTRIETEYARDPGAQVRDNLGRPLAIAEGKPLKGLV